MQLERFSFGVGDRFAHQAGAQLRAFQRLSEKGVQVIPVWNKSNREHTFIGSEPKSVRDAALAAVKELNWQHPWHVDADHIRLETVDRFLPHSDFFTIDVADSIGKPPAPDKLDAFVARHPELNGPPANLSTDQLRQIASKYLLAVEDAGKIYRHISNQKGEDNFIAEVSMDETDSPQTPPELLVILAAMADERIKPQTIAPKFTGRFNKGVDYVGDLKQFEKEFNDDLEVIRHAVSTYGLPANLKLSVHSGSDKFSLYPIIRRALNNSGAGLHIKTAGTTWLEEVIGLAEAGGDGLQLVREFYRQAHEHLEELCAPYASVIDIQAAKLPSPDEFDKWSSSQVANSIRHIPSHPEFNPHIRQLLHVAFKLAAKAGSRYTGLLKANREVVARNVTENLYDRHMKPLFLG